MHTQNPSITQGAKDETKVRHLVLEPRRLGAIACSNSLWPDVPAASPDHQVVGVPGSTHAGKALAKAAEPRENSARTTCAPFFLVRVSAAT